MVAILTRIFGFHNIETAEDLVQEAFARALKEWTYQLPANPSAWLIQTAKNLAIDLLRRQRYRQTLAGDLSSLPQFDHDSESIINTLFMETEISDSQLRMIFACCHPRLSETDRIVITLKTCSGFSVHEIARGLLISPEAIKKRIQRVRGFIRRSNITFNIPVGDELRKRLDNVLRGLYLIFNEGYNSSGKERLIRRDLCKESLRLAILLTNHPYTNVPKCNALVSLMSLLAARFDSRLDEQGEIVLLEDQDRSTWNSELIRFGLDYLNRAASGNELSQYHLEAAIVAEHSMALSFAETNWTRILSFYDILLKHFPSPVIALNRAIVVSKLEGPQKAIDLIRAIPHIEKLVESQYLFPAVLGDLHVKLNEPAVALPLFEKALQLTNSPFEKKLIQKKMRDIFP